MASKVATPNSTGAVNTVQSLLLGGILSPDGATATWTITDGNGGDVLAIIQAVSGEESVPFHIPGGVEAPNGIYVTKVGTGSEMTVYYKELVQ